jgi:hypothetical protein
MSRRDDSGFLFSIYFTAVEWQLDLGWEATMSYTIGYNLILYFKRAPDTHYRKSIQMEIFVQQLYCFHGQGSWGEMDMMKNRGSIAISPDRRKKNATPPPRTSSIPHHRR